MTRRWARPVAGFLISASLAACSAPDGRPLPPSVPVMQIAMSEYHFEHEPTAPGGRVVLRVANNGRLDHAMTLLHLPPDFDLPVQALFNDGTKRTFPTTAQVFRRPPGARATLAVDLQPGRYALICFVEDADGIAHVRKGMLSEFRVAGGDGGSKPQSGP